MSRKLLIAGLILGSSLLPAAYAEDTAATSNEMAKDAWLNLMMPMLPDLICKGFMQDEELKKRFDELKLTFEQCVTLIPESSNKCKDDLYASIPDKVNSESAATWGKSLGECIGKDFAEKHLIPKDE
jgi:hypothetical protein